MNGNCFPPYTHLYIARFLLMSMLYEDRNVHLHWFYFSLTHTGFKNKSIDIHFADIIAFDRQKTKMFLKSCVFLGNSYRREILEETNRNRSPGIP